MIVGEGHPIKMSLQNTMGSRQPTSLTQLFIIIIGGYLIFLSHPEEAAVTPNGQYDKCGPYYLWYQIGPDSSRYTGDYVDLCEITFDVTDVFNDFEFVYFTDQRAILDQNQDGISDLNFYYPPTPTPTPTPCSPSSDLTSSETRAITQIERPTPTPTPIPTPTPYRTPHQPTPQPPKILKWKPEHGCVRIPLRECWSTAFNEQCGYSMISIQPKPGLRNGHTTIPVLVKKRCPPYGVDCNESLKIVHAYSDCYVQPTSGFFVQASVDKPFSTEVIPGFDYTIKVQNTGEGEGDTEVTDTFTPGSNGGHLTLSQLAIDCPKDHARCTVIEMNNEKFRLSLIGIQQGDVVTITYRRTGNADEVSRSDVSYFTNTVTLSNGNSVQTTVGIKGSGQYPPRRPERPKPHDSTHR
jgi:hypothetical protein